MGHYLGRIALLQKKTDRHVFAMMDGTESIAMYVAGTNPARKVLFAIEEAWPSAKRINHAMPVGALILILRFA